MTSWDLHRRAQQAAPLREKANTKSQRAGRDAGGTSAKTQCYGGPVVNPGPYVVSAAPTYQCGPFSSL